MYIITKKIPKLQLNITGVVSWVTEDDRTWSNHSTMSYGGFFECTPKLRTK